MNQLHPIRRGDPAEGKAVGQDLTGRRAEPEPCEMDGLGGLIATLTLNRSTHRLQVHGQAPIHLHKDTDAADS